MNIRHKDNIEIVQWYQLIFRICWVKTVSFWALAGIDKKLVFQGAATSQDTYFLLKNVGSGRKVPPTG